VPLTYYTHMAVLQTASGGTIFYTYSHTTYVTVTLQYLLPLQYKTAMSPLMYYYLHYKLMTVAALFETPGETVEVTV
jgi:hypothetical protein